MHSETVRPFAVVATLLLLLAAFALAGTAAAQTYPDRPIKIIVPVGPAGSYDIVGRLLADQLGKRLGQNVSVENRPGAGTVIGTQAVAAAPADGYTLLVGGLANMIFNAALYKKLPYDPLKDFVPIALVFNISYTLVGSKDLPYSTAREIVAAARQNPDRLKIANVGIGSGQHIFGAVFQKLTGTKLLEVSYRGSAAAFPDVLAGRVDLFLDSTPAVLPYVKSGEVKGIAVLAPQRNPQMPEVPTMTEAGVPGLEIESWIGLFAPAGTPRATITRLQQEIAQALPELKPRFAASGGESMDLPPEKVDAFVKSEYDRWIKLVRETGITLD
ncbi:MAG: Bug family tripartite tricarboxylate transporter substrate binding protein [Xanthobacteraceae bacterium]